MHESFMQFDCEHSFNGNVVVCCEEEIRKIVSWLENVVAWALGLKTNISLFNGVLEHHSLYLSLCCMKWIPFHQLLSAVSMHSCLFVEKELKGLLLLILLQLTMHQANHVFSCCLNLNRMCLDYKYIRGLVDAVRVDAFFIFIRFYFASLDSRRRSLKMESIPDEFYLWKTFSLHRRCSWFPFPFTMQTELISHLYRLFSHK